MNQINSICKLVRLQKEVIGEILTIAEASLPSHQFRAFKKLIFDLFHNKLKPETVKIMNEIDQARPVASRSSLGGKEVDVMIADDT